MSLLATRHLAVSIAGKSVCRDLTLAVGPGQCWAILGGNGVGKTTLLHTLAGVRAPMQGRVLVAGKEIAAWRRQALARRCGVLFQDASDAFPVTVLESVLIGRHPHLRPWQWEGAEDLAIARTALGFVGLEALADRSVATLSGGERRRVDIATVLAQEPDLMLLDEPNNHLDLQHQIGLLGRLAHHVRDRRAACVMVLHDVNLAARFCDHALLLFGAGETASGGAAEMLTEANLSRLYHYPVGVLRDGARRAFVPL